MLTEENNRFLTEVGPGTPMGSLMREYWLPALLSGELPTPDGDPVRVMLLGEQLIAFRDTGGKVGLIANLCPHRGTSLFLGRNEEHGIRCVYHGWKFDVDGNCVDMPNEPASSNFKARVRARTYPCQERGGVIWAYLGPRATPPSLPDIEANMLADEECQVSVTLRSCNWLQALEGDIDTSHLGFLHLGAVKPEETTPGSFNYYTVKDRAPRYLTVDTDYGTMYGAYRPAGEGETYWRVAQFLFPCFTHIPTGVLGLQILTRAWVPMDDTHTLFFTMAHRGRAALRAQPNPGPSYGLLTNSTDWFGRFRPEQSVENDYFIDRAAQRAGQSYTGIVGIPSQDQAVTELMGGVLDRTNEHLGSSDAMVIRTRAALADAATALADEQVAPPGVDDPKVYRVRSGGIYLPEGTDWLEGIAALLPAFSDHPELEAALEGSRGPNT